LVAFGERRLSRAEVGRRRASAGSVKRVV